MLIEVEGSSLKITSTILSGTLPDIKYISLYDVDMEIHKVLSGKQLTIRENEANVATITDHTIVTNIVSTSVEDLADKIYALISVYFLSVNDFGSTGNIDAALNSTFEVDNSAGNHSIAFRLVVPTGGEVTFEGTLDNVNWFPITLRQLGDDGYLRQTDVSEDYIGSISCLRKFRVRVSVAGSTTGTIIGRMSDNVNTIEGIEHGFAPHNIGYKIKKSSFEFLTPQTNTAVLTPTSGKRWVLTDIIFSVDGVNTVLFFDDTDAIENHIIKIRSGNERFFNHPFRGVVESSAVDNVLRVTSTNQADFRGTIVYYEID